MINLHWISAGPINLSHTWIYRRLRTSRRNWLIISLSSPWKNKKLQPYWLLFCHNGYISKNSVIHVKKLTTYLFTNFLKFLFLARLVTTSQESFHIFPKDNSLKITLITMVLIHVIISITFILSLYITFVNNLTMMDIWLSVC